MENLAVVEGATPPASGIDLWFNSTGQLPIDPSPFDTGQVNTYLAVNRAHDWFRELASTFEGIDEQVVAKVNIEGNCRARYVPKSTPPTLEFYVDSTFANCNLAMVPTIIYHEYGHYVLDRRIPGLFDLPEDAGFHEGFSDTFASLLADEACIGDGWAITDTTSKPCVRNIDLAQESTAGGEFLGCAGTTCEVFLADPRCNNGSGCRGLAMAGAFWDLRSMIGDAATERLFADFFLITNGFLDQSVVDDVLAVNEFDNDPNIDYSAEISTAFRTLHGWYDPSAPALVNVRWFGPPSSPTCDPEEGADYEIPMAHQLSPPQIVLKSSAKCGEPVEAWFIGLDPTSLVKDMVSVTTAWVDPQHNVEVLIGTESDKKCRDIDTVDILAQTSSNWSSVRTDLSGSLNMTLRCQAVDPLGTGGRFSGVIAGTVGQTGGPANLVPLDIAAIGAGANLGAELEADVVKLSNGLIKIPQGSVVRASTFSTQPVRLNSALDGTIEDKDILVSRIELNGGMGSTGKIKVNGNMRGQSQVALLTTGNLAGAIEVTGDLTGRITINGNIPETGSIRINGDILPNTSSPPYAIQVNGNVAGSIFADWDADGIGTISGPVLMGDFSGDICDASDTMRLNHQLPNNIFIGGSFTGRVCPPRTPLKVASLPHSATKNRMISINPRSTNNNPVALKVTLTAMPRCSTTISKACSNNSDCPSGESCQNHSDVGNSWWVGPPIDPTCEDDFGISTSTSCSAHYRVARLVNSPVTRIWDEDVIHIADCEVVPVATYSIEATEDGSIFLPVTQLATTGKPTDKQFGDVVGPKVGNEFTPPDGIVNIIDLQAVVFAITSPPNGPDKTWADLHGNGEGQPPNGLVNVSDVLQVVRGYAGDVTYFEAEVRPDPGQCPEVICTTCTVQGDPVALNISGSDSFLDPEEWLYVEVFTAAVEELATYEVALEVSGGTSGTLVLADIVVDDERSDFVFGTDTTIIAKNVADGRVGVLREDGGMEITGAKYLATFVYQPASGASGVFDIALKGEGASFLSDGNGGLLPVTLGGDEVVGVGVDCWETWHCNDSNQCTTDACVDYECVFTNATSGTACNDGHFCTATDTCNGSGVCTGTGNPCPPRTHWCNEFQDQCQVLEEPEEQ